MARYHIIDAATGYAVNAMIWDGQSDLILPEGQFAQLDDGSPVSLPPEPQAPTPTTVPELIAYAKTTRDAAEAGGITVFGVAIATDDRSKTLVLGARRRVERDPALITKWAANDGFVYPLNAATVIAVSDAIGDYVAALFDTYAEVMAAITDGSVTTSAQIDARFAAVEVAY